MRPVLALAMKDLRLLVRDKPGFFFTVFFPFLLAIFFGAIFSGQSGDGGSGAAMTVAVFDGDDSEQSRTFVQSLADVVSLEVQRVDDFEAGIDVVRRGGAAAAIGIPDGFGQSMQQMFWGDPAELTVRVDPSRQAEAGLLQGVLMEQSFALMQQGLTDSAAMQSSVDSALQGIEGDDAIDPAAKGILQQFLPALRTFVADMDEVGAGDDGEEDAGAFSGFQPVTVDTQTIVEAERDGPPNAYAISIPQGAIWGVLGACAGFGISLVVERTRGTLVRLRMAPLSFRQILAGKALACFITAVSVLTALFLVGWLAFGVVPQSPGLLVLAIVCTGLCFVGVMMLLSVVGRTESAAGGIGWAILVVFAMLGGGMVPVFIMPEWMQTVGSVSPVKWAILSMEGAVWRGYSMQEMLLPCAILLGIGALGFTGGAALFRARDSG